MQTQTIDRHQWPRIDWTGKIEQGFELAWYACYTRARHEKRVAGLLRDRDMEHFLPVHARDRSWHDRKKRVDFPLYPGYVFVHIARTQLYEVMGIPSVVTLLTTDGSPARIPDREIENIRRFVAALSATREDPQAAPLVSVGEHVVITGGPFRDVRGVVVEDRGAARVVVGVAAIGQGFSINVPTSQLRVIKSD